MKQATQKARKSMGCLVTRLTPFLLQWVLGTIAQIIYIIIEQINIIIVLCKYGRGGLDYYKHTGYKVDVESASRHRSRWNATIVREGGEKFQKGTDKSISYYIGSNRMTGTLTWFGRFWYYFLYLIDRRNRFKGGHCRRTVTQYHNYLIIKIALQGQKK